MSEAKHPKGLPFLFFAEMWERFGYYLMIGIFTLFLQDDVKNGGYGMSLTESYDVYGTFIALVFLTPFLGGLLADRKFGYRSSITAGGLMMGAGYCLLAVHNITVFYFALALIIFGNGFFKPNISTLLGNLYNEDPYKSKKDAGFNIFYMGINIGAFICNFFGAALYNFFGWGHAFMAAGVGMFIGIIIFWIGIKHYKHVDVIKPTKPEDASLSRIFSLTILPALVAGIIGWIIPGDVFGSDSNDAFIFGCIPVIYFYYTLYSKASPGEKRPIAAMLAIFTVVIAFWAVFKQNGTALTKWADSYTDRSIPSAIIGGASKLQLLQEIKYTKGTYPKTDLHYRKIKDDNGNVVEETAYPPYFKNIDPAQIPPEGEPVKLINTSVFQSVNPGWVIVLTPLVVMFFSFLRKRGKEPSTPSKIAWGLVISALSTFVMVAAVYSGDNGQEKNSAWFLIASYGVITVGELFLSPMGLSLVSKMSPPRLTALMMGGWFLSTSIGNKLSGILATMWDKYDNKANYFLFNFGLLIAAAAIIFMMLKWLNQIFKEHNAG